jgi:hypothetical protein
MFANSVITIYIYIYIYMFLIRNSFHVHFHATQMNHLSYQHYGNMTSVNVGWIMDVYSLHLEFSCFLIARFFLFQIKH